LGTSIFFGKKEFKALKKEIFSIADHVMEIGKKQKLELDTERNTREIQGTP